MNGRDVSNSSHDEAVEAFMQAEEPITVEVLRRGAKEEKEAKSQKSCSSTSSSSASAASSFDRRRPEEEIREMTPNSTIAVQTDLVLGTAINKGEVEEEDDDDLDELLMVPDLDYEASLKEAKVAFAVAKKRGTVMTS